MQAAPAAAADTRMKSNLAERSASQEPQALSIAGKASGNAQIAVADEANFSVRPEAQMTSSATSFNDGERKFIRTAQSNFRVKDVYVSALAIEDAVAAHGGFVVKNEIGSTIQRRQRNTDGDGKVIELAEYTVNGNLTVRVPSNKTQEFLRAIVNQVEFLDRRNFDAQDVRFDWMRQQLAMMRSQETQLELGQATREGGKLAQKTEAIAARNETKAARDEAKIAQKEFDDKVAFSTINLSMYQLSKIRQTEFTDVEAVFAKNRPSFGARIGKSLHSGWQDLLDVAVGLIEAWPLWIFIAFVVFAVRGWIKRRASRKSVVAVADNA